MHRCTDPALPLRILANNETGVITISYRSADNMDEELTAVTRNAVSTVLGMGTPVQVDVRFDPTVSYSPQAIAGGQAMSTCTAGFTVMQGGTPGIATAKHCGTIQSYPGSPVFQAASADANGDVEWFSLSSAVTNSVQKSPGAFGSVTGTANPTVGAAVCIFGKNTGQNCSTIYNINQCSGTVCTLAQITSYVTTGGDSGGPWFWGNTAMAIHSGQCIQGGVSRSCGTRIGSLNVGLSVSVRVTP